MLDVGQGPLTCKYFIRVLPFLAFFSLGFFLRRLPLVAVLPAEQPLCGLWLGQVLSHFWEGKYLATFGKAIT